MNVYSKETKALLKEKIGYRNDSCYSSNVYTLKDIINYEISELGNTDIIDFLNTKYNLCLTVFDQDKICKFIKQISGFEKLYGLWLASKEAVISLYSGNECISKYRIPNNAIVISDLGYDGCLVIYDKLPKEYEINQVGE